MKMKKKKQLKVKRWRIMAFRRIICRWQFQNKQRWQKGTNLHSGSVGLFKQSIARALKLVNGHGLSFLQACLPTRLPGSYFKSPDQRREIFLAEQLFYFQSGQDLSSSNPDFAHFGDYHGRIKILLAGAIEFVTNLIFLLNHWAVSIHRFQVWTPRVRYL